MLWTSDSGGRHHNGNNEYPLVLLGTGGGGLNPGRFLDFGDGTAGRNDLGNFGAAAPRSLSDAFVTIAHALGVPLDTFGDPAHFKGVLPGVLR